MARIGPIRLALPGISLIAAPLRTTAATTRPAVDTGVAVANMAPEALGGPSRRRCSTNGERHWIEIRGLDDSETNVGETVLSAVRATPGVREASLNTSVARVVVTVDADGPSLSQLCALVSDAERAAVSPDRRARPVSLPGDDEVLIACTAAAAVAAASFGLAVTGNILRLGRLSELISVPSTLLDHIPSWREEVVARLGPDGADFMFALVNSTAAALTGSPTSAAAEAAIRTMQAAEAWNARRAWRNHEPRLARHPGDAPLRNVPERHGPTERHA